MMKYGLALITAFILSYSPAWAEGMNWTGSWTVSDTSGQPFVIDLQGGGMASGSMGSGITGKWKQIDGNVYIRWQTGWKSLLFRSDDGYGKMAFSPSSNNGFRGAPTSVSTAVRN